MYTNEKLLKKQNNTYLALTFWRSVVANSQISLRNLKFREDLLRSLPWSCVLFLQYGKFPKGPFTLNLKLLLCTWCAEASMASLSRCNTLQIFLLLFFSAAQQGFLPEWHNRRVGLSSDHQHRCGAVARQVREGCWSVAAEMERVFKTTQVCFRSCWFQGKSLVCITFYSFPRTLVLCSSFGWYANIWTGIPSSW